MTHIDPLASVHPKAEIGYNVSIGPFCVVEANAVVGDRCKLEARSSVKSDTILGSENTLLENVVLGGVPQHISPPEELGGLIVGSGNTFRENVTINRALSRGDSTIIGDKNFFMANSHVGHDCVLGNQVIIANNSAIGGHVTVDNRVFISAQVGIHQFCRVGALCMIASHARITQDVPPYVMVDGGTSKIVGLNVVGIKRAGYKSSELKQLKEAYKIIYRSGQRWQEVIDELKQKYNSGPAVEFNDFFIESKRGYVSERRVPAAATVKMTEPTDDSEATEPRFRVRAG